MDREKRDPLDEAWSRVREGWADEARHRAFVAQCAAAMRLDVAARKYREAIRGEVVDYRGEHAADAERRLREVVAMAQATALVPAPKPNKALLAARTLSRFAFGALVLLLVVFLVLRALR
ncbi:MAG: hypothetical protein ACXWUG_10995 [Polyangiales bacterium]